MPTLWPIVSTQDIRIGNELDGRIPTISRHQVRSIPGRFSPSRSESAATHRPRHIHHQHDAETWVDNQLRQICSDSDSSTGVPGHNVGHRAQHQVVVRAEVHNAPQCTSATDVKRQLVPQTGPVPTGETQLCHVRDSKRKATLSFNSIPQSTAGQNATPSSGKNSRTGPNRTEMVVGCSFGDNANSQRPDHSPAHNGCLRRRVGRSAGRIDDDRSVDDTSTELACQSQRAICCSRSNTGAKPSTKKRSYTRSDRQPHSGRLHQQGRWDQIQEASEVNRTVTNPTRSTEHLPHSPVLPGQIQRRSRCPVSSETSSGVAPHGRSHSNNLSQMGSPGSRRFCLGDGSRSGEVCVERPTGHGGSISQCILSPVEFPPSLDISPTKFDSASTKPFEHSSRTLHNNSTEMDKGILDGGPQATSPRTSTENQKSATSTDRHADRCAPTTNSGHSPRGLADFGWSEMMNDWTEQEKSLLMSSWRSSTLKTYTPIWRKWKIWCSSNSINFKHPTPANVARYLAYLHNVEGLAYRTILVYKSVIATFTNIDCNVDLSNNFFIKHVLKAISVSKEKTVKPPIWNPKLLLQYLTNHTPDETNLYQVSRRAAILLLLSSGRRVHDLTLLQVSPESFIDEGDSITLWPSFGSKTDNARHRQSGWKLLENADKNLCCLYWLRRLIQVSSDLRKPSKLTNLFITVRGECKPASRTIIGGWVKSALRDAGIEAPPGSVRSAVASLNWIENFTIDQILATGNWKQEHTFRKFYQKQLEQCTNHSNTSVSLSNYFNAVNHS